MKKIILPLAFLLLLGFNSCGRGNEEQLGETISHLLERTFELNEQIGIISGDLAASEEENTRLTARNSALEQLYDNLSNTNAQLNEAIDSLTRETSPAIAFSYGLTVDDVRENLVENLDVIAADINQLVGYPIGNNIRESVLSHEDRVMIRSTDALIYYRAWMPIMLFYKVNRVAFSSDVMITNFYDVDWDTIEWGIEINWTVAAYGDTWYSDWLRTVQPPAQPRHLTNMETVAIRIYNHDWDTETESRYRTEVVVGAQLWEETIRLIPTVRDLWFDGTILYVDLLPVVGRFNIGLGSIVGATAMRETFESFPHQNEVRFLVGGVRPTPGTGYNGFDINCLQGCPVWGTWGMGSLYDCICVW